MQVVQQFSPIQNFLPSRLRLEQHPAAVRPDADLGWLDRLPESVLLNDFFTEASVDCDFLHTFACVNRRAAKLSHTFAVTVVKKNAEHVSLLAQQALAYPSQIAHRVAPPYTVDQSTHAGQFLNWNAEKMGYRLIDKLQEQQQFEQAQTILEGMYSSHQSSVFFLYRFAHNLEILSPVAPLVSEIFSSIVDRFKNKCSPMYHHATAHLLLKRSHLLLKERKPDEALTFIEKSKKHKLAYPLYYASLGSVFLFHKKFKAAEQKYSHALALNPRFQYALFHKAEAMIQQDEMNNAALQMSRVDSRVIGERSYLLLHGQFFLQNKDWFRLERVYRQLMTVPGSRASDRAMLGTSLIQQQRFGESEAIFRSLVNLNQNNAAWQKGLYHCLLAQGKYDELTLTLRQL